MSIEELKKHFETQYKVLWDEDDDEYLVAVTYNGSFLVTFRLDKQVTIAYDIHMLGYYRDSIKFVNELNKLLDGDKK